MQQRVCGIFFIFLSCFLTIIEGHLIDGIFTEPTLQPGYNLVATFPRGASSLNVTELRHTPNYLAIRLQNGTYLINGNYNINWSGEYKAAGTTFVYRRQSPQHLESFSALGPIQEPIDVMILYQEPNPGIVYRYVISSNDLSMKSLSTHNSVPNQLTTSNSTGSYLKKIENISVFESETRKDVPRRYRRRKFAWKVVGLTECSKVCGGGFQTMRYVCVREHNQQQVPEKRCHALDKPTFVQLRCNVEPCTAKWIGGPWSECSVTCGKGTRSRVLECVQVINGLSTKVTEDACTESKTSPTVEEVCNMQICEDRSKPHRHSSVLPGWSTGAWSQCSTTCGPGTRTRIVSCSFHEKSCDFDKKPISQEICNLGPCSINNLPTHAILESNYGSEWLYTEWSEQCSADCGTGVQTRRVFCGKNFLNETCDDENRPETTRTCSSDKACSGQWFIGPWSQCSPSCDLGEQHRDIVCVTTLRGLLRIVLDMNCPAIKPETQKSCKGPPCFADWFTSDWLQCTRSCGKGVQKREVQCLTSNRQISESCTENNKPLNRRICNDFPCKSFKDVQNPDSHRRVIQIQDDTDISNGLDLDPSCKDSIANCNLVTQARLCRYQFYQKSCCLSCSLMKHDNE